MMFTAGRDGPMLLSWLKTGSPGYAIAHGIASKPVAIPGVILMAVA